MVVKRLLILFAGETGNCEDVARIIYRQSKSHGIPVKSMSISDYPVNEISSNENCVLFICSTTGQGNEPTPLKSFWSFIMKRNLPSDFLSGLSASVIGLGDSSYIKYNVVGKKLYKRLQLLGANMIMDLALGDDQHDLGLWASIDPWLTNFWSAVKNLISLPIVTETSDHSGPVKSSYLLTYVKEPHQPSEGDPNSSVKIISNERATPVDHFQEVRFIKIDLNGLTHLNYSPGDVALIIPENPSDEVDSFLKLLNLDPKRQVQFQPIDNDFIESSGYNCLPQQLDVLSLVTKYLDIHSIPKRAFFDLLWQFSLDELEKQKLKEFATIEGQQDLYNYCHKPKRNILEVLSDFPHTCSKIPLSYLLDLIPCIRPRAFSIASSLSMYPNELHLLVAVVQYRTTLRKPRLGLGSNYLAKLKKGSLINLSIRSGEFKIPKNDPLIMIGPGTGVAPFRSIIQQRIVDNIYNNILFFGCRFSDIDYYFKDEWIRYQDTGHLKVFTAFSRENLDKKWYVQDEMAFNQSTLIEFMFDKKCTILIAGSSNQMPDDVRNCIKKVILNANEQFSSEEVERFICKLEASGKIQYECWS